MKDGIYLDCETTGLGAKDRICEICMVKVIGGEVSDRYHKMFDPGMPLNTDAERVTGLNYDRDLKGKQQFHPNEVIDWLRSGMPIHAYSASFDRRMLRQEFERWNVPLPECEWIDVLKDAKALDLPNHKQATVAEHFGISTTGSHSAGRDVEILMQISTALAARETNDMDTTLRLLALEIKEVLEVTTELDAETYHDSVVMDSAINNLQKLRNRLEKERKAIVAEPTKRVKHINSSFKKVRDLIDDEKVRLDAMVKRYLLKSETIESGLSPAVGKAVREKTYNIMYSQVDESKVELKFLKLDEFAIECEIRRQMEEGIDPPRIKGVPLEVGYVVKRRAR